MDSQGRQAGSFGKLSSIQVQFRRPGPGGAAEQIVLLSSDSIQASGVGYLCTGQKLRRPGPGGAAEHIVLLSSDSAQASGVGYLCTGQKLGRSSSAGSAAEHIVLLSGDSTQASGVGHLCTGQKLGAVQAVLPNKLYFSPAIALRRAASAIGATWRLAWSTSATERWASDSSGFAAREASTGI